MTAHQEARRQQWFRAWFHRQSPDLVPMSLVLAGFLPRFFLAWFTFLNPDEILHYLLSDQASLRLAYQASLTSAHPPLMILFLYYWRVLGHAEWVAASPEQYVATAIDLARRPGALRALRARLRDELADSSLMDTAAFTRNLERLYRSAWEEWCNRRSA